MDNASVSVEEIREGFLCPLCLQDLGNISQLRHHFDENHSSVEEKDIALNFKNLFFKAKETLFRIDSYLVDGNFEQQRDDSGGIQAERSTAPQEIGITVSHTDYFKRIRDSTINDFVVQTNKLLIRLDKLIGESPFEPAKRKAFEQSIIPWIDDTNVSSCALCCSKFSLAKRKHHCRLCGLIMCYNCSQFLTFVYCKKLINPAFAAAYSEEVQSSEKNVPGAGEHSSSPSSQWSQIAKDGSTTAKLLASKASEKLRHNLSRLKVDGGEVSLNSFINQDGEEHLRVCKTCKVLLDRRDQQIEQRTQAPAVVQMYERLMSLISEIKKLFPTYTRMAELLNAGDSMYTLDAAQELRVKILTLEQQVDNLSKGLQKYNIDKAPPRQCLVQRNIRSFVVSFLQDLSLNMLSLPTEKELSDLQQERKTEAEHRVREERLAQASSLTTAQSIKPGGGERTLKCSDSLPSVQADSGWTANPFKCMDEFAIIDPLNEQIVIIKNYIRQAAEAGRLEEVKTLERNLVELEHERENRTKLYSSRQNSMEAC